MTGTVIPAQDFAALLRSFGRDAYRQEYQTHPLTFERDAFQCFLDGSPLEPHQWPEWQGWLDRVMVLTSHGKQISRVIVVDAQPTPYQRWRIWAAPWHRRAGEDMRFLPAAQAAVLGNWWLLDGNRVILQNFTATGGVGEMKLITGTEVNEYRKWRDQAMDHATMAESIPV